MDRPQANGNVLMASSATTAPNTNLDAASRLVLRRVDLVTKTARYWQWVYALGSVMRLVLPVALLLGLIDYEIRSESRTIRYGMSVALLTVILYAVWRYIYSLLRSPLDLATVARHIESRFSELSGYLGCAIDFVRTKDSKHRDSHQLRQAVIQEAAQRVEPLDLRSIISRRDPTRALAGAAIIGVTIFLLALLQQSETIHAANRLTHPWQSLPWPQRNRLEYAANPTLAAFGDDVKIIVVDHHQRRLPSDAHILIESLDLATGEPTSPIIQALMRREKKQLIYSVEHVSQSFRYRVVGGDDDTLPWVTLEAIPRPHLNSVAVSVIPPIYSGGLPRPSGRHIRALEGSHVEWKATSSRRLRAAWLFIDEGGTITQYPTVLSDNARHFHAPPEGDSLTVHSSGTYWFEIEDDRGIRSKKLSSGQLHVDPDRPPQIDLLSHRRQAYVTPDAVLVLRGTVSDDIAVRSIQLHYQRAGDEQPPSSLSWYERPPVTTATEPSAADNGNQSADIVPLLGAFDLRSIAPLQPGHVLHIALAASDDKPQAGRLDLGTIQVVSPSEMRRRLDRQQADVGRLLEEALQLQRNALQHISNPSGGVSLEESLQCAQLEQRQIARRLTDDKEGAIGQLQWLVQQFAVNRLEAGAVVHRLAEMSDRLSSLSTQHVSQAEQKISILIAAADSPPDDLEQQLDQIINHQQHIIQGIHKLIGEFTQRSAYQTLLTTLDQVLRDQQALCNATIARRDEADSSLQPEALRTEGELLARRQGDLARRLEELLREARQHFESAPIVDRISSEGLARLYRRAQEQALALRMREAQGSIDANHLADAVRTQETVLLHLQELLGIVVETRREESELLAETLRQVNSDLSEALQRLEETGEQLTAWATDNATPPPSETTQAANTLREISEILGDDADRIRDAMQQPSAAALDTAAADLSSSSLAVISNNLPGASVDADHAKEVVRNVSRYLSSLLHLVQRQQQSNELQQLEVAIRQFHTQQESIGKNIERFNIDRTEGVRLARPLQSRLRSITRSQGELAQQVQEWIVKTAPFPIIQLGLTASAEAMEHAVENLQQQETGEATQAYISTSLEHFDSILMALTGAASATPITRGDSTPPATTGGSPQAAPLGPTLAELQLVAEMEAWLLARTIRLEEQRHNEGPPPQGLPNREESAHALVSLQLQLADMIRQWTELGAELGPSSDGNTNSNDSLAELMKDVADRLEGGDTGIITQQHQERIVDLLRAAVDTARQNSASTPIPFGPLAGDNSSTTGTPSPLEGNLSTPGPTNGEQTSPLHEQPPVSPAEILDQAWGELPDRIRQELPTPKNESFLPGYEQLIEDYFRRLSEDRRE